MGNAESGMIGAEERQEVQNIVDAETKPKSSLDIVGGVAVRRKKDQVGAPIVEGKKQELKVEGLDKKGVDKFVTQQAEDATKESALKKLRDFFKKDDDKNAGNV